MPAEIIPKVFVWLKIKLRLNKLFHEYELHIDEILKMIESDFKIHFPHSKDFIVVSNKIFKQLNLKRY